MAWTRDAGDDAAVGGVKHRNATRKLSEGVITISRGGAAWERDVMRERFRKLAYLTADIVGSPWAFLLGAGVVLLWGLSGPYFHYSDTWQLVINTGTTIVTFLVVFLIQGAQNRDSRALHLKLDELLRAVAHARTSLVDLESRTDDELDRLQQEFERLRQRQGAGVERCPEVLPQEAHQDTRPQQEETERKHS